MSSSKMVLRILYTCIIALLFVLIIFGVVRLSVAAYSMGYRILTEEPMDKEPGRDVIVEVEKGVSPLKLGKNLEEKGLIRNAYLFVIQMKLSAYANKVQPGVYTLSTSQTAREMLQIMSTVSEKDKKATE
jgi:cell division protein YceG involved in septum cleavage